MAGDCFRIGGGWEISPVFVFPRVRKLSVEVCSLDNCTISRASCAVGMYLCACF